MPVASGCPSPTTAAPQRWPNLSSVPSCRERWLITDDWSGYACLRKRGYDHHAIAECGDPEVAEEFLPIIHLVFSILKRWLNGIHHGVSAKHLQAYLASRYSWRRGGPDLRRALFRRLDAPDI